MTCPHCDGVGAMAGAHTYKINPCPYCKGKGLTVKWYARTKGSTEWHGGWDTKLDALRGIALQTSDPLPYDLIEQHYEFDRH